MTTKEIFHGVPGILRPFKEFIEKKGLKRGDQIVYYGVPVTCTPFVELLAFAGRSLEPEQVFVPFVDEHRVKKIGHVDDVGMQARIAPVTCRPKAIVILGGPRNGQCPGERRTSEGGAEQISRNTGHQRLHYAPVRESRVAFNGVVRLPDRCNDRPG